MTKPTSIELGILQDTLELLEWPRLCSHLAEFASTAQGRLHCRRLSLPPDFSTSRLRLDETLEMCELDNLIEGGVSFKGVHDLEQDLLTCFKGGVLSGEALLDIADTLAAARRLRRQIYDQAKRPRISSLLEDVTTLPRLEQLLKLNLEEGGRVADRASSNLFELRRQRKCLLEERRERLQELLKIYGSILQDTVISERNRRPVLALKARASSQLPGLVHGSSASGSTLFVEPKVVVSMGNKLIELDARILQEEHLLLAKWSTEVANNFGHIEHLYRVLLHLDVALARARYGDWLGGVPPKIQESIDAPFSIKDLRHPLLVWQERKAQGAVVVPTTLEVSSNLRVVAITGPNTGGKTVILKSIGLATLMARAGLLLPCQGIPSLPWCAQVLADIGDEQSIEQNLSTFSSHINRISCILEALDRSPGPALVLLDEVGAGTDPTEGSALAMALLKTLANRTRLTVATTHFGEIKALKYNDPRFENASVSFDDKSLSPTFRLQWGIPGRSNALAIASRLGLDQEVIEKAQDLIGPLGIGEINEVIRGLEDQRKRQQTAAEDASALLARAELLHEELLSRWQEQTEQSAKWQQLGRQKLENSIREGQKEVRSLIRRMREAGADGETARIAGQRLRTIDQSHHPSIEQRQNKGWKPQVGDRIRLLALGKAGEVLEINDAGTQLTVRCGVLRTTVELSSVESLDGCKPMPPGPVVTVLAQVSQGAKSSIRTSKNTVDVRGLRIHEAEVVVEDYLRRSNGPLWVIHGTGSGRLKRGLREWLDSLAYVDRVNDADQRDGGAGCSVIWLR